jgi:protein-arginine kinase activator protein McsA
LLKKIHGSNVHLGKAPLKLMPLEAALGPAETVAAVEIAPSVDPVELLRRQLHEAIEHEDFERAAALRDKIHELEGQA